MFAVYRVYGQADQCLYVGSTQSPWVRMRQHNKRPELAAGFIQRVELTWHGSLALALAVERSEIERLQPTLNEKGKVPIKRAASGSLKHAVMVALADIGQPSTSVEVSHHMGLGSASSSVSTILTRLAKVGVVRNVGIKPDTGGCGRPQFIFELVDFTERAA
jgi:hypothetical protein